MGSIPTRVQRERGAVAEHRNVQSRQTSQSPESAERSIVHLVIMLGVTPVKLVQRYADNVEEGSRPSVRHQPKYERLCTGCSERG